MTDVTRAWDQQRALPSELIQWVSAGNETRSDPSDPYRGQCGALTIAGTFCRNAAGRGTDYPGIGRCKHHPLPVHTKGLAPWIGGIDRETWFALTGSREDPGLVEHGASEVETLPFGELMARHFDGEERSWWRSVPNDPIDRIDLVVRYRFVALGRVSRGLARLRALHNGMVPENKALSYEALSDKISQTIARLEEVRAKYLETQSGNETRGMLRDVLRGLSDEEYAALKSNPAALAALSNPNP